MKKADGILFFSLSDAEKEARAAQIIQQWWKQLHLQRMASKSFHYIHNMVSLEQAQKDSFTKLEEFILDSNTLNTTHKLLMHLEQTKDLVWPSRKRLFTVPQAERQFLAAYMIVTKSKFLFESPTDMDDLLLSHAEKMLKSFEDLCAFMSSIYLKKAPLTPSPLAERTPCADQVLRNIENKGIKNNRLFMTQGQIYLKEFHKNQMAYYETFTRWESNNRYKLAKILITKYLEIELHRFKALNSLDSRMLELYENYKNQQEILRKRLHSLLGEEGNSMLLKELNKLQASLEANKWTILPAEALIHELALNPKLVLTAKTCSIHPQKDVNAAISALAQEHPKIDMICAVLEEIGTALSSFTPNNKQQLTRLQQVFNQKAIKTEVETMGLQEGLYKTISLLIEQIQLLESPAHAQETRFFLDEANQKLNTEDMNSLLRQSVDFLYYKLSQINLEINNFHINQARDFIAKHIVALEQEKFQERLLGKQFNLEFTLRWMDKFASSPQDYRLELPILCSQHVGSYVAFALFIAVLQQSEGSILHLVPETFYLDRLRILHWHTQYHNLLYTVTALSYLEAFCHDYNLQLSHGELLQEKDKLRHLLETNTLNTPKEKAEETVRNLNRLFVKKNKELTLADKNTLTSLIEKCGAGTNQVTRLINKRLGDQLFAFLCNGRRSEDSIPLVRRYGLTPELNQLGKEIIPMLRVHTKVHSTFYQQQMERRLWKPLFTALRQTAMPLPSLLLPEKENIHRIQAYMHKFAFVLSGLALIQQTIVYSDMFKLDLTIKNATLKTLANSFGLIDMIKTPGVTKDTIKNKLMTLMQHVANEYKISYEKSAIARMLRLAKDEQSLGCKAFLDELIALTKHDGTGKKETLNPNNLIAEFREEVLHLRAQITEIIKQLKQSHQPYDEIPEAQTIPLLQSGRTAETVRLSM